MSNELLKNPPYSFRQKEKDALLLDKLNALTDKHRQKCAAYDRILSKLYPNFTKASAVSDLPYLPVGLFKTHVLSSLDPEQVYRVMTSSGTTGQAPSRIYLDRETAQLQTMALSKIITSVCGPQRLPMLIIDCESTAKSRDQINARTAGVLGLMTFGRDHQFVLQDDTMKLDLPALETFLSKHGSKPFLVYGFTFMIWQYFFKQVKQLKLEMSNAILIHSGGWKKLTDEQVSNAEFKRLLTGSTGINKIYNFYGMIEQTGSIFLEGEDGFLYPPYFADIIVRDPQTWQEAPVGMPGVIQVLSVLPDSYPGHSLLTEDIGIIHGIDDSTCGRFGKRFTVIGRAPRAELRGCSDVHAFERQEVR